MKLIKSDKANKDEFKYFIANHLKYPEIAERNGVEVIVIVKFVIDEKGKLTNAEITRSVDPALDEEVSRIVNLSPQ